MEANSPFTDSHQIPGDQQRDNHHTNLHNSINPETPRNTSFHDLSLRSPAQGQNGTRKNDLTIDSFVSSDQDSLPSALPTPNLNVDRGFELHPKQQSLRFKLPRSQLLAPSSPIPAIPSLKAVARSPFVDPDSLGDLDSSTPLSPFADPLDLKADKFDDVKFKDEDPTDIKHAKFADENINDNNDESYVQFDSEEEEEEEDVRKNNDAAHRMKRHRWGTTRNKKGKPNKESLNRSKTLKGMLSGGSRNDSRSRQHLQIRKPNTNGGSGEDGTQTPEDESDAEEEHREVNDKREEQRLIMFNRPLPDEMLDENGITTSLYPRNKIRTTRYTPLNFLPMNIFHQFFNNIANIYFLTLNIMGAFQVFGVPSPALAAVPLIVIVIITAFKDAVEDSRRTASDMEINNQLTHILDNAGPNSPLGYVYENINVNDDKISLWRRFKKWNTRTLVRFIGATKRNLTPEGRAKKAREKANRDIAQAHADQKRKSMESMEGEHPYQPRKSYHSRRSVDVTRTLHFGRKFWKDVKVGDILRINNNDPIPADVVILSTSEEDSCCYVETKDLDGETNLKVRQALKYSSDIHFGDDLILYDFQVNSEGPHPNLYSYQGNLESLDSQGGKILEPITINNLLLRGCILRNTKWAIGMVVFTGADTKVMLNAGITPTKQLRISRDLNYYIYLSFILLFIVCFVSGLVNGLYYAKFPTSRDFYEFGNIGGPPWKSGILDFFVTLILYQSIIPISLYITIEIIKTAQAFFIYSDIGMYYPKLDFPCIPKSWSISDDLGQIEYIFSDKTGTLTQNLMEFKKCTINGVSYGLAYTEALAGMRKRMGIDVEAEALVEKQRIADDKVLMYTHLKELIGENLYEDELTLVSSEFTRHLLEDGPQKDHNEHFMLALALCHSVLAEHSEKEPKKQILKAQSPDEAALVGTARALGFGFQGTTKRGLLVNIQGDVKEYQILNTLEFNSTRKRMSAIIKIPGEAGKDPTALLICKGADSIIYDRLSKSKNDKSMLTKTSQDLEEYANEGLRTLCIAQRELSWSQYESWNVKHEEAAAALVDREAKMEAVADLIERELVLLGGTAIEDRLQEGVPDAISILGDAGIKLWVLTGDKVETAINIGFSCNLLGNDMELLLIKTALEEKQKNQFGITETMSPAKTVDLLISRYLNVHFQMDGLFEELQKAEGDHLPPHEGYGVVIDGEALKLALLNPDTRRKFLLLCKQCKAVLCCRVSPAQKAAVVKLVKDTLDVMTLAIGDGLNDVAMIQAADVGVGIAGEEGRQAVMSSDYGLGQFRFLARLLLVHGRWNYKRFAELVPLFFFKNVIFLFTLFWYGIYSDFDGTYLFEFTFLMFYNLAFTSIAVIFMGVFDQDVSDVVSLLVPQLYKTGILRSEWTQFKFWWYVLDGVYQLAISFFFPYLLYRTGFASMNGLSLDHRFWMGLMVTCISCIACNLYILIHQYRWDWLSVLGVLISIFLIYFWALVWLSVYTSSTEFYKAGTQLMQNAVFWAVNTVGVVVCLLPRFLFDVVQKLFWPKDIDIIRECVQRGDFAAYPIGYDPTDPNKTQILNYSQDPIKRMSVQQYRKELTPSFGSDSEGQISSKGHLLAINEQTKERISHPLGGGGSPDINGFPKNINSELMVHRTINNNNERKSASSSVLPKKKRKSLLNVIRQLTMLYDNSSLFDTYNEDVATEEIQLDEFDNSQRRALRISSDRKRTST